LTKELKLFSQLKTNIDETKICYYYSSKSFNFNNRNLDCVFDIWYNKYNIKKVNQVKNNKIKICYYNFDNFDDLKEF